MKAISSDSFGLDPKVQKAVNFAQNASVTKAPILIIGESGVGKRTLANYVHLNSNRADGSFYIVDCSEDPQKVENNTLGYRDEETGRFHKGALELANGGTVVFANIDGLADTFQTRLHTIFGELTDYDIDVRIISTTTKNLSKLVGSGRFYRGLFMQISGTQINMPPLRERSEDIQYLAQKYIHEWCTSTDKTFDSFRITDQAMNKIVSHYWTHNLTELKTVLESSLENMQGSDLDINELAIGERKAVNLLDDDDQEGIRLMSLKEAEKLLIKKALIHTSENRTQAAKILGVSIRTLRNKINEYRNNGNSYFVNLK